MSVCNGNTEEHFFFYSTAFYDNHIMVCGGEAKADRRVSSVVLAQRAPPPALQRTVCHIGVASRISRHRLTRPATRKRARLRPAPATMARSHARSEWLTF